MTLILNVDDQGTRFVDNKNVAFEGTLFAKHKFKIFYKRLTRSQDFAIQRKFTEIKRGKSVVDQPKIDAERFDKTVLNWEGIVIEKNGKQEEVECKSENKRFLVEQFPAFTNLIMLAILQDETDFLNEGSFESDAVDDQLGN